MNYWKLSAPFIFVAGLASGGALHALFNQLSENPAQPQKGDVITAKVKSVYDGDTMTLIKGEQKYKIRVWGIDAPERPQKCDKNGEAIRCGIESRDLLRKMTNDKDVTCEIKEVDRYNRLVSLCHVKDRDLAKQLVKKGFAFDDPQYSDGHYAKTEKHANKRKNGMWGMEFLKPAEWRACKNWPQASQNRPSYCNHPITGPNK